MVFNGLPWPVSPSTTTASWGMDAHTRRATSAISVWVRYPKSGKPRRVAAVAYPETKHTSKPASAVRRADRASQTPGIRTVSEARSERMRSPSTIGDPSEREWSGADADRLQALRDPHLRRRRDRPQVQPRPRSGGAVAVPGELSGVRAPPGRRQLGAHRPRRPPDARGATGHGGRGRAPRRGRGRRQRRGRRGPPGGRPLGPSPPVVAVRPPPLIQRGP